MDCCRTTTVRRPPPWAAAGPPWAAAGPPPENFKSGFLKGLWATEFDDAHGPPRPICRDSETGEGHGAWTMRWGCHHSTVDMCCGLYTVELLIEGMAGV